VSQTDPRRRVSTAWLLPGLTLRVLSASLLLKSATSLPATFFFPATDALVDSHGVRYPSLTSLTFYAGFLYRFFRSGLFEMSSLRHRCYLTLSRESIPRHWYPFLQFRATGSVSSVFTGFETHKPFHIVWFVPQFGDMATPLRVDLVPWTFST